MQESHLARNFCRIDYPLRHICPRPATHNTASIFKGPINSGVTNTDSNLQHIQILQQQITQLQRQIAQMRYRLRFLRLTPEGYRRYMAEIRVLEQRVNSLGWLLYRLLQNRR